MDENVWKIAQIIMWIMGIQTTIIIAVIGSILSNITKKIDKLDENFDWVTFDGSDTIQGVCDILDNLNFFNDGNLQMGWDTPGNDLEITMLTEPAGNRDLRCLATFNTGTQQNTFITTLGVVYDIYGVGVPAGNELSAIIVSETDLTYPIYPEMKEAVLFPLVDEKWGWNKLSLSEYNEYLEAESYAAHIGQFIHKGEKLDTLRKELPFLKTLEWMSIEDGKKTPLKVSIHHTSDQLLTVHNELAAKHRQYEQRVNYFKAKVKNLVTEENARISAENGVLVSKINSENELLRLDYNNAMKVYEEANNKAIQIFEQKRQKDIQKTSSLRVQVDPRFQTVVDLFLKQLEN